LPSFLGRLSDTNFSAGIYFSTLYGKNPNNFLSQNEPAREFWTVFRSRKESPPRNVIHSAPEKSSRRKMYSILIQKIVPAEIYAPFWIGKLSKSFSAQFSGAENHAKLCRRSGKDNFRVRWQAERDTALA
jgi:hypothetical protein